MAYQDSYKSEPIYPLASGSTIVSGRRHSCASGTLTPPAASAGGHFSVVNTGNNDITITGLGLISGGDEGRWVAAGATWRRIESDDGGMFIGSGAAYASLPLTNGTRNAIANDFAILTADTVGTGTAAAPQFPRGVYRFDGSNYQLSARLSNLTKDGGAYIGLAGTFASLPTTSANGRAAQADDWALLHTATVGTGTAASPQFPRGIYRYNGASYVLALEVPVFNAARLGGRYMGSGSTFATLPANNGFDAPVDGDWCFKSGDEIGTGTAASPQYPAGIYLRLGGAWLSAQATQRAVVVLHTGTPATPGIVSIPALAYNTTTNAITHCWVPASNAWVAVAAPTPVGTAVTANAAIASAQAGTQITIGELQVRYNSNAIGGDLEVRSSGAAVAIGWVATEIWSTGNNNTGGALVLNASTGAFQTISGGSLDINSFQMYRMTTLTGYYEVKLANRADQRIFISAMRVA